MMLSSSDQAALRILIDLPGPSLSKDDEAFMAQYPWAGVILFPKNIKNRAQTQKLIRDLQAINRRRFPQHPLFIAVDQEGGSVSPLEGLVPPSPGNMALAAGGAVKETYQLSRIIGAGLRNLGINVNFAPIVDVNSNPENPIIGIRSFGENPRMVGKFGNAAIQGFQGEGIMATAKHFPGHGDTSKDSHLDLPVVKHSKKRLASVELPPFKMSIDAGVWGMMTAHVRYPALDARLATLSKKILTDLLRRKLGFEGIIFTDSFSMAAIKEHISLDEAVIQSVKAGADVLLALGARSSQLKTLSILTHAIKNGKISEIDLWESLRRIFYFRKKLHEFKSAGFKPAPHLVQTLHEKCVTMIKGRKFLPLRQDATIFLSPEADPHKKFFHKYFKKAHFISWPWPAGALKSADKKWLFLAERRLLSPEMEKALQKTGVWDCAVAFGNPYHLKKVSASPIQITTYHCNELLIEAASKVILEGKKAPGRLPITL